MRVPIENSGQVSIIAASSVSMFLATLLVALRLMSKRMSVGIDHSDYCIVLGLVFNTALHIDCILMVIHGGYGFHTLEIFSRFGPDTATFFFKGIMAFAMIWNATVCFSKLSVLLMYTALIPVQSMIRWAQGIGLFIIMWNISNIFGAFLICRPLARNWDVTVPGTCGSQPKFYFSMGIMNIIADVALIALPMPYLYKLRMSMQKKLVAMGMLSIGVITWVIAIYRQTTLADVNFEDMTHSGVLTTILSGLEPSVAIALACVPLLRPLMNSRHIIRPLLSDLSKNLPYNSNRQRGGLFFRVIISNHISPFSERLHEYPMENMEHGITTDYRCY
ncbi:hypothetical protein K504DRAFT_478026 [Pleomassaria siparia CBS 279.74]|uniref:Rhodopsin domain-containing protein n=1 Tax=Pleomassaria siparia CBS 279.74 TaxID=1314801 RepID=A0A6G1KP09_9PLEO|nr:hypothetical protein K504DRAFT_478026 [Pleomassaria siparia CBS 279.74]